MKIKTVPLVACVFALVLYAQSLQAQYARFVESGVIEFEKRVNMYAKIENRMGGSSFMEQAFEQYKRAHPQFQAFKYNLAFGGSKTRFWPQDSEAATSGGFFGSDPSIDMGNIIAADLLAQQGISQKSIYEETYLITDSLRQIQWRFTNESREIAGYECRRANALVLDSIYVVAFYTDQIPISGGPESFTGLPGMILGVALPDEHVTYFATKVDDRPVSAKELAAPTKGKAVNYRELREQLEASLKNWGDYAQSIVKAMLL
ncbi:GLPGLI family protein [Parapedobacter sp. 10938]|uniref:GLPGLI family protein n=1 Tax=Parapedobacter flavus TaxID=3110225 RepID=UPI002DBC4AF8|nr:GLPGLI family protein [Parapedobacter sp. 10938]MEC3881454.1 GLPGLI family protein [Parapedobacter sp. 10938]